MRDFWKANKSGDPIGAGLFNKLGTAYDDVNRFAVGQGLHMVHTPSMWCVSGDPPFAACSVEVICQTPNPSGTGVLAGIWNVRYRYWDEESSAWATDEDSTYELDVNDSNTSVAVGDKLTVYWHQQRGMFVPAGPLTLRGGCLAEQHPGRGEPFTLYLGSWDASANGWTYDTTLTVWAIDWRYGVPYPDEGATGLFIPRSSDYYGIIWEVVSLDCSSPGPCGEEQA